jgi:hypothetical protein
MALAEVSMAELVKNDRVRDLIKNAQDALGRNDLQEAFSKAAVALAHGSADVHQTLDPPLQRKTQFLATGNRDINRWLQPVVSAIDDTLKQMSDRFDLANMLVSLGIDLHNYNKFCALTPTVSISYSEVVQHVWRRTPSDSMQDARWCVDFVTDFMLRVEGRRSEN